MVHTLNPSSNLISIHSEKMAGIPFSHSFILSLDICILYILFLGCHENMCIVLLSIYRDAIFQPYVNVPIYMLLSVLTHFIEKHDKDTFHNHVIHSCIQSSETCILFNKIYYHKINIIPCWNDELSTVRQILLFWHII